MPREPGLFLEEMADACERVIRYTRGVSLEEFVADDEKRSAVERQLFIIGEAANQLPNDLRERYPDVPWRAIIGLRNVLAHGYWGIDNVILWDAATTKVPALLVRVRAPRV